MDARIAMLKTIIEVLLSPIRSDTFTEARFSQPMLKKSYNDGVSFITDNTKQHTKDCTFHSYKVSCNSTASARVKFQNRYLNINRSTVSWLSTPFIHHRVIKANMHRNLGIVAEHLCHVKRRSTPIHDLIWGSHVVKNHNFFWFFRTFSYITGHRYTNRRVSKQSKETTARALATVFKVKIGYNFVSSGAHSPTR